jgi:coenzyme F420-reducing hydrogenase beta subunit
VSNNIRKLYIKKEDCCGCGACVNVCPQNSIYFKPDENGFLFPEVDMNNCIDCDLCETVCAFQNGIPLGRHAIKTYAAIHKNKNLLLPSSSGGVFSALAEIVFAKNGVVYGCAWDENLETEHICISSVKELHKLQGSKYVQSNIGKTFREAKAYLKNGKYVLFSGTPCQIAGLKSFLGKEYENLITAELVCHGVPNVAFFKSYIGWLENKLKGKIARFIFRDKSNWGMSCVGRVYLGNGEAREKIIYWPLDPYYSHFMYGHIYRESCYQCKYASTKRQGDFTLGDYWGIQKAHPEIDTNNGVSVLLVNSEKGLELVGKLQEYLYLTPSTFEQAALENGQLTKPIPQSDIRETVLSTWREGGFQAVADKFYKNNRKEIMRFHINRIIPKTIKSGIKKVLSLHNITKKW